MALIEIKKLAEGYGERNSWLSDNREGGKEGGRKEGRKEGRQAVREEGETALATKEGSRLWYLSQKSHFKNYVFRLALIMLQSSY